MSRVAALAILLTLGLAPAAFAGTAQVGGTPGAAGFNALLTYAAAPGERNQVVVRTGVAADPDEIVLGDAGAVVLAGPGCSSLDEHTVRCAAARTIVVDAGDGDDAVALPSGPSFASGFTAIGGDGADKLTGAGALYGGPGDDALTGGDSGACDNPKSSGCGDLLVGGSGDDVLRGVGGGDGLIGDGSDSPAGDPFGAPTTDPGGGNDVIDGGEGEDTVLYRGRRVGVRIDLAGRTASGAVGERDLLAGIENAVGGDGPDLLLGNDDRNRLTGGAGSDRLDGRGGNDRLDDIGPDADTLRGGDGNDKLFAPGRRDRLFGGAGNDALAMSFDGGVLLVDTLHCGSGRDLVRGPPRGQLLTGCENVQLNPPHIGPTISSRPRQRPSGALRFDWICFGPDILVGCQIKVALRLGSSPAVRRSVSIFKADGRHFEIRTARRARRGEVLRIAISGGLDYGARGGTYLYTAHWRVRM